MARSVNPNTGIKGMDIVLSNLNKEIVKMKANSIVGLLNAAGFIRRDMEKTPPLIPVDFGNLRGSWFTTFFTSQGLAVVVIGFNANYALFVHEMVDGSIDWKRPNSGPKFLEAALNRNKTEILALIAKEITLK